MALMNKADAVFAAGGNVTASNITKPHSTSIYSVDAKMVLKAFS